MTFRHVWVSLAALTFVAACSSDDTIVSLNVSATDRVPAVESLKVTFTQGSRKLVRDFEPPTDESSSPEGEPVVSIKNSFYERLTLPDDWEKADAKLVVEAFQKDGVPFDPPLVDETTVSILPNKAVAAYVQLDIPAEEPPPGGEGGAGGAGGAGAGGDGNGAGGVGGTGGTDAGGAGAANGGEPSASGAAGEMAIGGVGGAG